MGLLRLCVHKDISIHAPHTGRDSDRPENSRADPDFNPRAPYGARPLRWAFVRLRVNFNPRAPYGARLVNNSNNGVVGPKFQSTRPIRGATCTKEVTLSRTYKFQSTRPIRGATLQSGLAYYPCSISIHAPHTGRDTTIRAVRFTMRIFQSTRPIRGATAKMHNLCSAFLQQQTIKA